MTAYLLIYSRVSSEFFPATKFGIKKKKKTINKRVISISALKKKNYLNEQK